MPPAMPVLVVLRGRWIVHDRRRVTTGNDLATPGGSCTKHAVVHRALTGERHEVIATAAAALKPREPAGEPSAAQERAELLLDEPRQAVTVSQTSGMGAERFEMRVHDSI